MPTIVFMAVAALNSFACPNGAGIGRQGIVCYTLPPHEYTFDAWASPYCLYNQTNEWSGYEVWPDGAHRFILKYPPGVVIGACPHIAD